MQVGALLVSLEALRKFMAFRFECRTKSLNVSLLGPDKVCYEPGTSVMTGLWMLIVSLLKLCETQLVWWMTKRRWPAEHHRWEQNLSCGKGAWELFTCWDRRILYVEPCRVAPNHSNWRTNTWANPVFSFDPQIINEHSSRDCMCIAGEVFLLVVGIKTCLEFCLTRIEIC